jgi:hypothetical protein
MRRLCCAALALICLGLPSHAQSDRQNTSNISQAGADLIAETVQDALGVEAVNISDIQQTGTGHSAAVDQTGTSFSINESAISQMGDDNSAELRQTGLYANNRSLIQQFGARNSTSVAQSSDGGATSSASQSGDDNTTDLRQFTSLGGVNALIAVFGLRNDVLVDQFASRGGASSWLQIDGEDNQASIIQSSGRAMTNSSVAQMTGAQNGLSVFQAGEFGDNVANASAIGSDNTITITQLNEGVDFMTNNADVGITGTGNAVTVAQGTESAWGTESQNSTAVIVIDGSANMIDLEQTGSNANSASFNLTGSGQSITLVQD